MKSICRITKRLFIYLHICLFEHDHQSNRPNESKIGCSLVRRIFSINFIAVSSVEAEKFTFSSEQTEISNYRVDSLLKRQKVDNPRDSIFVFTFNLIEKGNLKKNKTFLSFLKRYKTKKASSAFEEEGPRWLEFKGSLYRKWLARKGGGL